MLDWFIRVLVLSAGLPIWLAWRSNRHTTLIHACTWLIGAWLAWTASVWAPGETPHTLSRYLALCLTACSVMAVLGARRPGVAAWNFVVAGLLTVLLLPMGQRLLAGGELHLDVLPLLLLGAVLAVGVFNYAMTTF